MSQNLVIDSIINIHSYVGKVKNGYIIDGTLGYRLLSVLFIVGEKPKASGSTSRGKDTICAIEVPPNIVGQEIQNIEYTNSSIVFLLAGGPRIIISEHGITI